MVRFKNRYVLCRMRFPDAPHATETTTTTTTTKESLFAACAHQMELQFGRLGATRMRRSTVVKYYDAKYSNVFVVRCARKDVGKMKLCVTNISNVEKKSCQVRVVGVHGKLGSAKENALEHIGRLAVEDDDDDDDDEETREEKKRKVRRKVEKAIEAMTS